MHELQHCQAGQAEGQAASALDHYLLPHQPPRQLMWRHQGPPLPEVSSADVGHPGAAHGTGLDEVLGCQHDGFDASLHWQLVVLHRDGDEQAGATRQVRAPAPAG